MSSIPLAVQAPSFQTPVQNLSQVMQLRDLASQVSLRQQQAAQSAQASDALRAETEQKNRDLADQNVLQEGMKEPAVNARLHVGDFSDFYGKVQPNTLNKMQQAVQQYLGTKQAQTETQQKIAQTAASQLSDSISGLLGLTGESGEPDLDKINAELPGVAGRLASQGVFSALSIPGESVPTHLASVDQLRQFASMAGAEKAVYDHILSQNKLKQDIATSAAQEKAAGEYTLTPGEQRFGPDGKPLASVPAKKVPGVDVPYSADVEGQRLKEREASRANTNLTLTPAGVDEVAEQFYRTGQMPALGMGAAGMRAQIINRAAELHPGADLASNTAEFAANKSSLTKLQANRDAVVSFENTALKNLDQFLGQAKKVVDTGSPWINSPLRTIDAKLLGNADLPAYNAARQVAVNEIAKVISNPALTGQLSDSARREVSDFNPENATLKQSYQVAQILKQDMANRHQALDETLAAIKARIGKTTGAEEDPHLKAYADQYFGGDTEKAKAAIAAQKK